MSKSTTIESAAGPRSLHQLVGCVCHYCRPVGGWISYLVRGWYLDANGCVKTYGDGYAETFFDQSSYSPNKVDIAKREPWAFLITLKAGRDSSNKKGKTGLNINNSWQTSHFPYYIVYKKLHSMKSLTNKTFSTQEIRWDSQVFGMVGSEQSLYNPARTIF